MLRYSVVEEESSGCFGCQIGHVYWNQSDWFQELIADQNDCCETILGLGKISNEM